MSEKNEQALLAKFEALHAAYEAGLRSHRLGAAGVAREDAGQLVCENWESVLYALRAWALPRNEGCTDYDISAEYFAANPPTSEAP